jgi:signal transduction histidine kinase
MSAKARGVDWSLDEFLAMVSHELRNPTQAILGWAEVIGSRPLNDATLSRAIGVIKRNVELQSRMIDQLLDFSLLNGRGLRLDVLGVAIEPMLQSAIETVVPLATVKTIELHAELEHSSDSIIGDPTRLQQIFTNLLSNAIKFTPPGGRVEVRSECRRAYAEISVSDTGRGISAQFLPHVFDRFRQEKVAANEQDGLGLGLAISRYLVERHHGRIHAFSRGEGQGATFKVYLPLESRRPRAITAVSPVDRVGVEAAFD